MGGSPDAIDRMRTRILRATGVGGAGFDLMLLTFQPAELALTPAHLVILALAAAANIGLAVAPWPRLLPRAVGARIVASGLAASHLATLTAIATSRWVDTDIFWFLVLGNLLAALLVGRRGTAALTAISVVGYPIAAALGAGQTPATTVIREVVLVATTALLVWIVRAWHDALELADRSTETSHRHAAILSSVAETTASLLDRSPEEILRRVVASGHDLGFDRLGFWMVEGDRFVIRASSIEVQPDTGQPLDVGLAGDVLRDPRTVVAEDYTTYEHANDIGRSLGLSAVVGCPVFESGRPVGVQAAGLIGPGRVLDAPMVRAVELLAATAGRALDVAARSEAERRTVAELQRLDGMKDDFIATVSHEMRTPLAVMLGATETLLARGDQLGEEMRTLLLHRATDNGHALRSVIETLLDVGRLDRGSLRYSPVPVRCDTLVTGIVERLGDLLIGHELTVDADPVIGIGDPDLLGRVVENLLTNSLRHTPDGTAVYVTVAYEENGRPLVRVSDDGPGIPASDLARLGERFFRGGDPNKRGNRGVGLGLSLVSEILQLHGTELEVDSEIGRGTSFAFRLERAPIDPASGSDATSDPVNAGIRPA